MSLKGIEGMVLMRIEERDSFKVWSHYKNNISYLDVTMG